MALLEVNGLRRTFGALAAVDGVSFSLEGGQLAALVGPNGCGKSTLFNLITGALAPTAGRVVFDGDDITGLPVHAIARRGVGRKFQVPAVFDELTVAENVMMPGWVHGPLPLLRRAATAMDRHPLAAAVLARIGLADKRHLPAAALSHGERQWLEIGMLLASDARLLLLDEPTAGMTVAETAATADLIHAIMADGHTIMVIEHDMGFVERLRCPVMMMAHGRILRTGSYAEMRADPEVKALYFGRGTSARGTSVRGASVRGV